MFYINVSVLNNIRCSKSHFKLDSLFMADKSSNEGEKTFAIIVGLLAGVALIIIFLTFIRKVFGEHGNVSFTFSETFSVMVTRRNAKNRFTDQYVFFCR